ncbi:uncharacterized protein Z518_11156 [Rhinocladiella mackenziei CBS 650.93]|uniref:Rhinocladiella mackenziei CBS 650.93 unplaced genomic scaffold supercont1.11, whole genome shotgun sequence n=1 Tax=Rhinocladiella mackenziei CBS 650.93 TaxID=1442369 RepID=A0A0D2I1X4_9EURO|nr:uncharacterized protein Z518_11156 [Rhinocladiella mackenziei CBS 650.93]KIW99743.1 hypothetical protein Z518_11156 [Rhinocladiella mackenziei CBS 650.93]
MAVSTSKDKESTHEEYVPEVLRAQEVVDHNIHHPVGWWNWRVLMNSESILVSLSIVESLRDSYIKISPTYIPAVVIVGLSMGLYGYDNNFVAPLLSLPLFILKYQGGGLAFTARNLDVIVTVPLVGAAIGTFMGAPLMKYIGRKKTFLTAYFLLCTPGSLLQLFAPNLGALVVGRLWNYLGVSVLTTTAPLYLSELVPTHIRGRAVGFCIAGVAVVAIFATTIVWGTEKINDERQYKVPLAIQAACPVAFGCLTLLCSESPVWYAQHDRLDRARLTLMALRNNMTEIVDAELSMHQVAVTAEAERRRQTRFWDILHSAHLKRTITAGALLSSSQVGGQILVGTYSTVILVQSGVANPFQITIIITCLQCLGTIIGPTLVDKAGRRPVAITGFSILFLLNMTAGGLAAAGLTTKSQRLGLAAVFITFAFFNAASFLSLAFVLPTEIATTSLREPTMAWSLFWSYVTAVITTFAVPQITAADAGNLGAKAAFIFGGCVFITLVWAYFYIPETKARTIAEVDEMYAINLPMRRWRNYQCQAVINTAIEVQRHGSIDGEDA